MNMIVQSLGQLTENKQIDYLLKFKHFREENKSASLRNNIFPHLTVIIKLISFFQLHCIIINALLLSIFICVVRFLFNSLTDGCVICMPLYFYKLCKEILQGKLYIWPSSFISYFNLVHNLLIVSIQSLLLSLRWKLLTWQMVKIKNYFQKLVHCYINEN